MVWNTQVAGVLCLASVLCVCLGAESASISDLIPIPIPAAHKPTPTGSWSPEIEEERTLWEQQAGKEEPSGIVSSASKAFESFFFDDGVPSDAAPFSAATPEEIAKKVVFHLYNKTNGDHNITGSVDTLVKQGFHPNVSTTLLIHGYAHDVSGAAVQPIKNRILATATNLTNVIGVDWAPLCPRPHYVWSRSNVKPTGDFIGQWLAQVVRAGLLRPADIHIVGHSLGAHLAGSAARAVGQLVSEKIARVTGLDPAFPLFARATPETGKISPSDANLVDILHTAKGRLGLNEAVGHVDFYANGGSVPQPGCGVDLTSSCSHERVCFLFAESVGKPYSFPGRHCPDGDGEITEEKCTGTAANMGFNLQFSERGKYFVKTEATEPFDPASHKSSGNSTAATEKPHYS